MAAEAANALLVDAMYCIDSRCLWARYRLSLLTPSGHEYHLIGRGLLMPHMQRKSGSQAFVPAAVNVLMQGMTTHTSASRTAGTAAEYRD